MTRFLGIALFLLLSPVAAFASCSGPGGVPFNCTVAQNPPGQTDPLLGGQSGKTVQFSGKQIQSLIAPSCTGAGGMPGNCTTDAAPSTSNTLLEWNGSEARQVSIAHVATAIGPSILTSPSTGSTPTGSELLNAIQGGNPVTLTLPQVAAYALQTPSYTTFTPSVTCGSGTLTSYTVSGNYLILGKLVFVNVVLSLTNIGSCATSISIGNLPLNSYNQTTIMGRENAVTGKLIIWSIAPAATSGSIVYYDNTTPIANGLNIVLNGFYEAQ